jgi:hypothetical protein
VKLGSRSLAKQDSELGFWESDPGIGNGLGLVPTGTNRIRTGWY